MHDKDSILTIFTWIFKGGSFCGFISKMVIKRYFILYNFFMIFHVILYVFLVNFYYVSEYTVRLIKNSRGFYLLCCSF